MIKIPNYDIMNNRTYELSEELSKQLEEEALEREEYKTNILSTLQNIEKNTRVLYDIVSLISVSNKNQTEVIYLINELLIIATARTSQ